MAFFLGFLSYYIENHSLFHSLVYLFVEDVPAGDLAELFCSDKCGDPFLFDSFDNQWQHIFFTLNVYFDQYQRSFLNDWIKKGTRSLKGTFCEIRSFKVSLAPKVYFKQKGRASLCRIIYRFNQFLVLISDFNFVLKKINFGPPEMKMISYHLALFWK